VVWAWKQEIDRDVSKYQIKKLGLFTLCLFRAKEEEEEENKACVYQFWTCPMQFINHLKDTFSSFFLHTQKSDTKEACFITKILIYQLEKKEVNLRVEFKKDKMGKIY
jgi:hypothetical protein